ncbi:hypothetical protein [Longivirga aurantiaca]|uniref:Uncharacterized protein n=1 Tax=Longivirga aurantiaca TaxID=1837743 RepID=A0ABW1T1Y7_9ACTN
MDLTLQRQHRGARARALRGAVVPVAAFGGACVLSAVLLVALSDLVERLG